MIVIFISTKTTAQSTVRLARDSLLLALAVAFSWLESFIPLPAGMRVGLASVVVMYALLCLSTPEAYALCLLKSGFVFLMRGVTAGLLSLAGGLLSMSGMCLLLWCGSSLLLMSTLGGMLHNLGQLILAMFLLQSPPLLGYCPVLLLVGGVSGMISAYVLRLLLPMIGEGAHLLQVSPKRDSSHNSRNQTRFDAERLGEA